MKTPSPLDVRGPTSGPLAPFATWQVDLSVVPTDAAIAQLSTAEAARAARFLYSVDRTRYLAAHVAMRQLLRRYCDVTARREIYAQDAFGKWRLAGDTPWHFNLSYAGQVALIGIARDRPIGLDIELERSIDDADALAALHFDADERAAFGRIGAADRNATFLYGWTRKEACLKAVGIGLRIEPADLHTGLRGIRRVAIGARTVDVGSFRLGGIVGAWAQACRPVTTRCTMPAPSPPCGQ